MDTPYQWTKQVASHWGGTRNGTIVHWPAGIESEGEVRQQFHHVIDVATTVLDAAGLPHPREVDGVAQQPLHGVSMRYSFDDTDAADERETQYFEMFVNRGIYHQGWTACTRHSIPWLLGESPDIADDVWELCAPDDSRRGSRGQRSPDQPGGAPPHRHGPPVDAGRDLATRRLDPSCCAATPHPMSIRPAGALRAGVGLVGRR